MIARSLLALRARSAIALLAVLAGVFALGLPVRAEGKAPTGQATLDLTRRSPQLLLPKGAAPVTAPRRIVSLAPVLTETLFLLERGDRVVGVTRYCDTPAAAQALPKVGGYVDVSLERVLALHPDLVVAMPSMGQRELLERLRDAGVPVLAGFGDTLAEVRELVVALGALTGQPERADAIVGELGASLERFARARPGERAGRVLVAVGVDPIVVAGPGSFIAEILDRGAVRPAVTPGSPQWPVWSLERLSRRHVDRIIVAAGPDTGVALQRMIDGAFPPTERPRVVSAPTPLLMRPGPAIGRDLDLLTALLRDAPTAPATPAAPPGPAPGRSP